MQCNYFTRDQKRKNARKPRERSTPRSYSHWPSSRTMTIIAAAVPPCARQVLDDGDTLTILRGSNFNACTYIITKYVCTSSVLFEPETRGHGHWRRLLRRHYVHTTFKTRGDLIRISDFFSPSERRKKTYKKLPRLGACAHMVTRKMSVLSLVT